jgi:glycosyltransferase involved in cell wall biosynthesis
MRVSVIVTTWNRADCLPVTLRALRHQTHRDFEVLVVMGPCTDHTADVLAEFAGTVRVLEHPDANINKQRNLGVNHAAGEVVAFIDDDAIPDPRWLEQLVAGYDRPDVGGVGGVVYDHTGYTFQFAATVCDRKGDPVFGVRPPYDKFQAPGADPFAHIIGTNSSYRRSALASVGGFDEEIEYYLDETELCLTLADRGHRVKLLDRAAVYHKFLPSELRTADRMITRPYRIVKNKFIFGLRAARPTGDVTGALAACTEYARRMLADARTHASAGRLTAGELARFEREVADGIRVGCERGLGGGRLPAHIFPAVEDEFLPYPTVTPVGRRLTLALIAGAGATEPPADLLEAAVGLAARGHEPHLILPRVDFDNGAWVHRIPPAAVEYVGWAVAAYREVSRIASDRSVDVVAGPDPDALLAVQADGRFAVTPAAVGSPDQVEVTYLRTPTQTGPLPKPAEVADRLAGLIRERYQLTARAARTVSGVLLPPPAPRRAVAVARNGWQAVKRVFTRTPAPDPMAALEARLAALEALVRDEALPGLRAVAMGQQELAAQVLDAAARSRREPVRGRRPGPIGADARAG